MEQSPSSENYQFLGSREIPRVSWTPKVHYRIHKCPPPVLILSQINADHNPTSYFYEINLFLSSHLRLCLPTGLFP